MNRKYLLDLAERVGATAAAAGIGYAVTQLDGMSAAWVPMLTIALTVVKGVLAKFVGDGESAGLK